MLCANLGTAGVVEGVRRWVLVGRWVL